MQDHIFEGNLVDLFFVVMAILLLVQTYILVRIRNILSAVSLNFEALVKLCRKLMAGNAESRKRPAIPRTCQFCKHRLAYINTAKTRSDEEDFYHRCAVHNRNISLDDTCSQFDHEMDRAV